MRRDPILRIAAGAFVRPRKVLKKNRNFSHRRRAAWRARAARVLAAVPGAARKGLTILPRAFGSGFFRRPAVSGTNRRGTHCHDSRPPISPSPCSAGYLGRSRHMGRLRPCLFGARFLLDLASALLKSSGGLERARGQSELLFAPWVLSLSQTSPTRGVKR
jgi:hypothetical protein